jgi:BirA family biotin operon repressor/biotin-[acetyl-CoA-carboxylase] ligase
MFDIRRYDVVDSTQELAKELLATGAHEHLVVDAAQQRKGKGRLDREWISPHGGLYLSVVLRHHPLLPVLAAVAVARALRAFDLPVTIKWPNDILLEEKKIAGILTELHKGFGIVGIGVNIVAMPVSGATSVHATGATKVSRDAVVDMILTHVAALEAEDPESWLRYFKNLSSTLGRHVRIQQLNGTVEGLAIDVDVQGALIIQTHSTTTTVTYGDCIHLR